MLQLLLPFSRIAMIVQEVSGSSFSKLPRESTVKKVLFDETTIESNQIELKPSQDWIG